VARKAVFERVLADIAAEKPESRAQHHLVVGQRGMGKSTLLARLAAELRTDAELSKRFVPLVFAEEQYAVDRLSKILVELPGFARRCGGTRRETPPPAIASTPSSEL
jgi:predicted AAA+ superfamily ATPase